MSGTLCSERLPSNGRLRHSAEFARVFAAPSKTADDCFTVFSRARSLSQGPARLGLAISRKCAPRAVDRSRIKRLVRESFRRHRHALAGRDLIVMCRRAALAADNVQLSARLTAHWSRHRDQKCVDSPAP